MKDQLRPAASFPSLGGDAATPKKKAMGSRKLAQLDIFNFEDGEDHRLLKPTYRPPLPGTLKKDQSVEGRTHIGASPSPPALRKIDERIYLDVSKRLDERRNTRKSNPDESDSDMSTTSNVPATVCETAQALDKDVFNFPSPNKQQKKSTDEMLNANKETYGGYAEPLAVRMMLYSNPKTLPISQVERARLNSNQIPKPGPPPVEKVDIVTSGKKSNRTTTKQPPRKKRKYNWKGGVAPKRRLGLYKKEIGWGPQEESEVEEETVQTEDGDEESEDNWMGSDSDDGLD